MIVVEEEQGSALHSITDQLNEELLNFEKALQDLNLGVTASIPLYEESAESPGPCQEERLEFVKKGKAFILVVSRRTLDEADFTPLRQCSRSTRLVAVSRLRALHTKIQEAYEEECQRVRGAVELVRGLTQKVGSTS